MIVAIDPGHGLSNREPGVYDPGACNGPHQEAALALRFGLAIARELQARGATATLTRENDAQPCPLNARVGMARAARADLLLSIHLNSSANAIATGTETLFFRTDGVARRLQGALVRTLGLRDRGVTLRDDLAVLKYEKPAVLLELGFISNTAIDLAAMLRPDAPTRVAVAIAEALQVGLL